MRVAALYNSTQVCYNPPQGTLLSAALPGTQQGAAVPSTQQGAAVVQYIRLPPIELSSAALQQRAAAVYMNVSSILVSFQ